MKYFRYILLFVFFTFLMLSCTKTNNSSDEYNIPVYQPSHATGFEILGHKDKKSTVLRVLNPWQGAENHEIKLFIEKDDEKAPNNFEGQVVKNNPQRVVCMSSSYVAMLDALGEVETVVGVSGIDYISNSYISNNKDKIKDIGYDGNINYEELISLKPDILLLYGIYAASGMEAKLKELGIPFIYIGEYTEQSPLGKAEWLVAIAEILGKRNDGEVIFKQIPERYNVWKTKLSEINVEPKVMLNTPYGDSWFMPASTSYLGQLISDAKGNYLYKRETPADKSLPIDLEQAYLLTSAADVWLNVGQSYTLNDLKSSYPKFANTNCVKNGSVYNCTKRMNESGGNDFWESGVIHPDLILRDLIKIFHPELVSDDFYYYTKLE